MRVINNQLRLTVYKLESILWVIYVMVSVNPLSYLFVLVLRKVHLAEQILLRKPPHWPLMSRSGIKEIPCAGVNFQTEISVPY